MVVVVRVRVVGLDAGHGLALFVRGGGPARVRGLFRHGQVGLTGVRGRRERPRRGGTGRGREEPAVAQAHRRRQGLRRPRRGESGGRRRRGKGRRRRRRRHGDQGRVGLAGLLVMGLEGPGHGRRLDVPLCAALSSSYAPYSEYQGQCRERRADSDGDLAGVVEIIRGCARDVRGMIIHGRFCCQAGRRRFSACDWWSG